MAVHLWEAAEETAQLRTPKSSRDVRGMLGLHMRDWCDVLAAANAHRRGQWWWSAGLAAALIAGYLIGATR